MLADPLDDASLRAIEDSLNEGRLDEAQRLLAAAGAGGGVGPAVAYLTARLLFHRGRLDQEAVSIRVTEVLSECPELVEARAWLDGIAQGSHARASVRRLETPKVPDDLPPSSGGGEGFGVAPPSRRRAGASLGALTPPRSEVPTEPAPPAPNATLHPVRIGARDRVRTPWDPLENALVAGNRPRVLAGLEGLASKKLDLLLSRRKPGLPELAATAAEFLTELPIGRDFAPFDLSLASLTRLDQVMALLVPPAAGSGLYPLRVLISAYLGECVRRASSGTWQGTLAEPERQLIVRDGDPFVPWEHVERALASAKSLRDEAGPPPHPGAEPPDDAIDVQAVPPTPWDPSPWPSLALVREIGAALPASVIGVWAERVAKVPLDRTPESLAALDQYAELVRRGLEFESNRASVLAGAYLGELLCLHAAGRFSEDARQKGASAFRIELPNGRTLLPCVAAEERLRLRRCESFGDWFYDAVG